MVKWLNHVAIAAPRNGSTTHTVDPSSGTVAAGALFTPTAGNFLVVLASGAVTSTTPAGWTLPAGGSIVNNSGLYLWHRTAVGGDTFTTTHNAANFPALFDIYEFPAGTTFIGAAAEGNVAAAGGAGPSLSGLTADADFRAGVVGQDIQGAVAPSYTWSTGTEATDTGVVAAGTDGYGFSLTYLEDEAGATFSAAATSTVGSPTVERIVFAVNAAATETTLTIDDPVGITDEAIAAVERDRTQDDLVGVTDDVDVTTEALRTISDSVGITDGLQVNLRKATRGMYGLTACWPDPVICEDCCSEEVSGLDPTMWQTIQDTAVDFLWRATGKQYGVCENTYRPCRRTCNGTAWGWPIGTPFIPWRINDQWTNLSCTSCPGECGCGGAVSEIRLTSIESVTGVRIDGVDLTPEDTVAVYDRYRIVRIDGEEWPTCQNLAATDGVGTWSVTVQQGVPVPAGGDLVAGILACEYAKACLNSKDCRLPRSVQSLVRQGVTMELGVPDIGDMLTGIYEVDSWIIKGRETRWQAPSILSPDRRPAARMTWPVVEA